MVTHGHIFRACSSFAITVTVFQCFLSPFDTCTGVTKHLSCRTEVASKPLRFLIAFPQSDDVLTSTNKFSFSVNLSALGHVGPIRPFAPHVPCFSIEVKSNLVNAKAEFFHSPLFMLFVTKHHIISLTLLRASLHNKILYKLSYFSHFIFWENINASYISPSPTRSM